MKSLFIALNLIFFTSILATAQKSTTIFVVRHAEKDLSNPSNTDPSLSGDGLQRSFDLKQVMQKEKITAVFSTNFKRTIQTASPLSQLINKEIIIYDPTKNTELVNKILENYQGKKVLVVGHSNTILTIVKAFGVEPSINQVQDSQYNLLFEITMSPKKTKLTERTYGQ
jgi:2,3-bisphosphoglycerate-dependent phosphoglycerate mutase